MVILTDEVVKMLKEIMDIFYLEKDLDVRMRYADQLAGSLDMALLVGENKVQLQSTLPILNEQYVISLQEANTQNVLNK